LTEWYILVNDRLELLNYVEIDLITIVPQTRLPPRDRGGKWTSCGSESRSRVDSGVNVRSSDREKFLEERGWENDVSEGIGGCCERVAT